MELRRVVVTGLGALTPIGNDCSSFWDNLLSGVSGAGPITRFDASHFKTRFACEVKDFDILQYIDRKEARKLDLFSQFAIAASDEAIRDARLEEDGVDKARVGVIFSTGMGGSTTFYEEGRLLELEDPRISPFFVTKVISDIASGQIAIRHGYMGVNYSVSSACASSANAIADATAHIRLGKADVIVTGGSEAPINAVSIAAFNSTRALSTRNESPQTASRPFDANRDGFVMGEGAGALVLEEREHALRRGARIYAEIGGVGLSADAYHITLPHPEGIGAELSMRYAMEEAGVRAEEVDHVNAHATSTLAGDLAEIRAICKLFAGHTDHLALTANKSVFGHLMGAAGAVEAISAILSIQHGMVPPTLNVDQKDENIPSDLDIVLDHPLKKEIRVAISNSFGFGGHNTSILFQKHENR